MSDGSKLLVMLFIALLIYIPVIRQRSFSKILLDSVAAWLTDVEFEKTFGHSHLQGKYKNRLVKCAVSSDSSSRYRIFIFESLPHAIPKTPSALKSVFKPLSLGNGFYLTSIINGFAVMSKPNRLGTTFKLMLGQSDMTPEKARIYLDDLVTACEQVERGDYIV